MSEGGDVRLGELWAEYRDKQRAESGRDTRRCACAPGCRGTAGDAVEDKAAFPPDDPALLLCAECIGVLEHSLEWERYLSDDDDGPVSRTALADFARRRSAELLNGGKQ